MAAIACLKANTTVPRNCEHPSVFIDSCHSCVPIIQKLTSCVATSWQRDVHFSFFIPHLTKTRAVSNIFVSHFSFAAILQIYLHLFHFTEREQTQHPMLPCQKTQVCFTDTYPLKQIQYFKSRPTLPPFFSFAFDFFYSKEEGYFKY